MKTFTCTIRNNWMASLEYASISITTPKGTTLTIDKWPNAKQKNKWDEQERESPIVQLVWKVAGAEEKQIELTREEVMLWKDYSDKQGMNLIKKTNKYR